jgi:hypothetical protein
VVIGAAIGRGDSAIPQLRDIIGLDVGPVKVSTAWRLTRARPFLFDKNTLLAVAESGWRSRSDRCGFVSAVSGLISAR